MNEFLKILNELLTVFIITGICIALGFIIFLRKHENDNKKIINKKNNTMKRFFGMMPSSEVKMSKKFIDSLGLKIIIDAGENGWTIMYADGSTEYKDIVDTTDNNFNMALEILKSHFDDIKESTDKDEYVDAKEC